MAEAGFANGLETTLSFDLNFAQINSFNQNMRYATAFFGEKGVPELRMDLSLRGGVTAETIAYTVRIFSKVLGDYIAQAQPESLVKQK